MHAGLRMRHSFELFSFDSESAFKYGMWVLGVRGDCGAEVL